MSKVRTFSQVFPSYHPRKGEPTHFVEKIWKGLYPDDPDEALFNHECSAIWSVYKEIYLDITPKFHTIRAGHHFKPGDWFSPRVWSGKPYNSKQIIIAPDIQVKNVWDFDAEGTDFYLSGNHQFVGEGFDFSEVEKNDGLGPTELFDWICLTPDYKKSNIFSGQIICWNENIEY